VFSPDAKNAACGNYRTVPKPVASGSNLHHQYMLKVDKTHPRQSCGVRMPEPVFCRVLGIDWGKKKVYSPQ
jgi:hypothetical protein